MITLNRPPDNAINTEMGTLLTQIIETIAVRPAVRVAILTGAGERAFSVGSDLRQRRNMTERAMAPPASGFRPDPVYGAPIAKAAHRGRERHRVRRAVRSSHRAAISFSPPRTQPLANLRR